MRKVNTQPQPHVIGMVAAHQLTGFISGAFELWWVSVDFIRMFRRTPNWQWLGNEHNLKKTKMTGCSYMRITFLNVIIFLARKMWNKCETTATFWIRISLLMNGIAKYPRTGIQSMDARNDRKMWSISKWNIETWTRNHTECVCSIFSHALGSCSCWPLFNVWQRN